MRRAQMTRGLAALALGPLLLALACAEEQANIVVDNTCNESVRWAGLEGDQRGLTDEQLRAMPTHRGATEMHPGRDCMACHKALGGPSDFVIAGTVFTKRDEPGDCSGVHGATVIIKDAAGTEFRLKSNPMGNFHMHGGGHGHGPELKTPFTVKLLHDGKERQMYTPQTNGSCNSCHTAQGTAPAGQGKPPGRICVDPKDPLCTP